SLRPPGLPGWMPAAMPLSRRGSSQSVSLGWGWGLRSVADGAPGAVAVHAPDSQDQLGVQVSIQSFDCTRAVLGQRDRRLKPQIKFYAAARGLGPAQGIGQEFLVLVPHLAEVEGEGGLLRRPG